jgi:transposase
MGVGRYELPEVQWRRIELLLPGRGETVGRPAEDNRRFVHGDLWVLRSGMRWQDMPERYGKYKTTHKRFTRWASTGVWDRVFADLLKDRENRYVMIDSSVVRAHQQAVTARKKGLPSHRRHRLLDQLAQTICRYDLARSLVVTDP